MSSVNGYVCIKNFADGEAGIDIIEGATPLIQPVRIFNNAGTLIYAIGVNGTINGSSWSMGVQSVSTTPVTLNALNGCIVVDATAGNIVLTLPAASVSTPFGAVKTIVKKDSTLNTVTINRAGSDTIGANGYTSIVLQSQGAAVTLQSDGVSVWHPIPEQFAADSAQINKQVGTSYTAVPSDYLLLIDASAGAYTLNLPAANAVPRGFQLRVKKIDSSANAVTVTRAGADTIEGSNTSALAAQWNSISLTSDGTSLWVKI